MSSYNNLTEYFTDLANAIREKTGDTVSIAAEDFPTAIEGISGGIQEISTESEMTALLTSENVGKAYLYTGTTGTYVNGDLYEVYEKTVPTVTMINFTINGTTYQAEDGMTWGDWINSSYNIDGYITPEGSTVVDANYTGAVFSTDDVVSTSDVITPNGQYTVGQ